MYVFSCVCLCASLTSVGDRQTVDMFFSEIPDTDNSSSGSGVPTLQVSMGSSRTRKRGAAMSQPDANSPLASPLASPRATLEEHGDLPTNNAILEGGDGDSASRQRRHTAASAMSAPEAEGEAERKRRHTHAPDESASGRPFVRSSTTPETVVTAPAISPEEAEEEAFYSLLQKNMKGGYVVLS